MKTVQRTVSEEREKWIGGSDIPIIMGLSPFKKRFDLLLEKAGYQANNFSGNSYTEYGNVMEEKIREYINTSVTPHCPFAEDKVIHEAGEGEPVGIRCHMDGVNTVSVLEIKTTSQVHDCIEEYKGYLVQLLFYMINADRAHGMLAVYNRPDDFSEEFDRKRLQLFNVSVADYGDLVEEIKESVKLFIEDLEQVIENPLITEDELIPREAVTLSEQIIRLENQLAEMKATETAIKTMKTALKSLMEEYHVKSWRTPNNYLITLVEDSMSKEVTEEYFDKETFKAEHEKLYKKYSKERTVTKKGRTGYVRITAPNNKED